MSNFITNLNQRDSLINLDNVSAITKSVYTVKSYGDNFSNQQEITKHTICFINLQGTDELTAWSYDTEKKRDEDYQRLRVQVSMAFSD